MLKMQKKRIWAEKKNRKIEEKNFFSGLGRNRLKLSKSPKNRFFDQYCSIYSDFSTKKKNPKKCEFPQKLPKVAKNAKFPSFFQLAEGG